ncbi:2-methoxy-6-polyprenyl-1,4-benzoquinol methylase, mitochondrial [Quillaja saponaria]|uniref:2-methoxy-6-polyprenyl-1,4-benzoquinol methylase, mitochondrial n=1 Tax=Quillaja saponaria TaxID=32244 RepID=A0AAD7QD33_QUISA|nr:2-methoxy-6-polyprenyl-1,4-benzoquinol methylase, mitochondrial [Quillaja saponaria]
MLHPFPGMKHLDVAGGTGIALEFHYCRYIEKQILETINSVKRRALQDVLEDNQQEETQIYVCDINSNMLNVGKKGALERGFGED